jgi:GxxExxY protein
VIARLGFDLCRLAVATNEAEMPPLKEAELTSAIIAAFYAVYDALGYGFLEGVYCAALAIELRNRGIVFRQQLPVDVYYQGTTVGHLRSDMIVADKVLVEVKSTKALDESDRRQVLNYLRATNLEIGMLLHFGPKPQFQRLLFTNDRKSLPVITTDA